MKISRTRPNPLPAYVRFSGRWFHNFGYECLSRHVLIHPLDGTAPRLAPLEACVPAPGILHHVLSAIERARRMVRLLDEDIGNNNNNNK